MVRSASESHVEEEAPEGGWGWMVAIGLAVVLIVTLGPMACFGLIFGSFLEELGEGTGGVTLINSMYMTLHSFTGLLTNYVLKSYSCRQVALFGAFLFFIGNFLTAFANSVIYMIFTFGILPGVGLGLMIPASFHCFNAYFIRRRVFVMGIAQTILSAGIMLYPIMVEKLVETYGFRGAQAIVAAMTLHAVVGAIAFIPAKRAVPSHIELEQKNFEIPFENRKSISHEVLKCEVGSKESIPNSIPISSEESRILGHISTKELTDKQSETIDILRRESGRLIHTLETTYEEDQDKKSSDNNATLLETEESSNESQQRQRKTNGIVRQSDIPVWKSEEIVDVEKEQEQFLLGEHHNDTKTSNNVVTRNGTTNILSDSIIENGAPLVFPISDKRHRAPRPSVISIGSLVVSGASSIGFQDNYSSHRKDRAPGEKRTFCSAIVDFFDLSLLKDPVYANLALGVSFGYYSDFIFVTLFPLFLFSLGISRSDAAICIAIGMACDLVGRVIFSLLGAWTNIRSRTIFLIGATCMVLGRTVMIYVNSYLALAMATGFHGFFRSWIHVTFSLVFAEHCSLDRFPSAYGLFMAISGVIGMSTGPLIGVIRDKTNSYAVCIHSLNAQMLLCVIPWILELIITKIRSSRKQGESS